MYQQLDTNPEVRTNTIEFDDILNKATRSINSNYEINSKLLLSNILDSIQKMAEEKEEPLLAVNKIVDYLGDLVVLLESAYGYKDDINNVREQITNLQDQVGLYLENDNTKDLSKLLKSLFGLVDSNKKLISTSANANSSEIAKELLVTGGKNEIISEKQEKLEKLLKVTINNELLKVDSSFKSFDFGKLDKLYGHLYEAIIEDNAEEITNARGNLISELKKHNDEIKELNEKLKPMITIKEILDSNDKTENRQTKINEILEKEDNNAFKKIFYNKMNDFKEFEKEFLKYYSLLDVKKVELYKDALKEELEEHGNFLKKRRNDEVLSKKVGIKSFPNSIGLSVKIFANAIDQIRYNNYSRKNKRLLKEAVLNAFNVVAVPGVCTLKFAAENWYTIYLVTNGIIKQHDKQVEAVQAAERLENEARDRNKAIMEYQKLHPELSLEEIEKIVDDYSKVTPYSEQIKMYQDEAIKHQEAEKIKQLEQERGKARTEVELQRQESAKIAEEGVEKTPGEEIKETETSSEEAVTTEETEVETETNDEVQTEEEVVEEPVEEVEEPLEPSEETATTEETEVETENNDGVQTEEEVAGETEVVEEPVEEVEEPLAPSEETATTEETEVKTENIEEETAGEAEVVEEPVEEVEEPLAPSEEAVTTEETEVETENIEEETAGEAEVVEEPAEEVEEPHAPSEEAVTTEETDVETENNDEVQTEEEVVKEPVEEVEEPLAPSEEATTEETEVETENIEEETAGEAEVVKAPVEEVEEPLAPSEEAVTTEETDVETEVVEAPVEEAEEPLAPSEEAVTTEETEVETENIEEETAGETEVVEAPVEEAEEPLAPSEEAVTTEETEVETENNNEVQTEETPIEEPKVENVTRLPNIESKEGTIEIKELDDGKTLKIEYGYSEAMKETTMNNGAIEHFKEYDSDGEIIYEADFGITESGDKVIRVYDENGNSTDYVRSGLNGAYINGTDGKVYAWDYGNNRIVPYEKVHPAPEIQNDTPQVDEVIPEDIPEDPVVQNIQGDDAMRVFLENKEQIIEEMMNETHVPRSVAEKFYDDFVNNYSNNPNLAVAPKTYLRAASAEEIEAAREQEEQRQQLKDGWVLLDGQNGYGISFPIPSSWAGFFLNQGYVLKGGILWRPENYALYEINRHR